MKYGEISYVKRPVSRLISGTLFPAAQWGRNCDEIFDAAYASGVTAFDTARCYMKSESVLGSWIERRGLRDKITLITKGGVEGAFGIKRVNEKCIRADLERSMSALRTNFIDLYFLHHDDEKKDVGEITEFMNALIAEKKIGAYGASNWDYTRIEESNEYAYKHNLQPVSASQPHFGLARAVKEPWKDCVTLTGKEQVAARTWYASSHMPVTAYCPLGRGMLSGKFKSNDYKGAKKAMDGAARRGFLYPENMERLHRAEIIAAETGHTVAEISLAWTFNQNLNVFIVAGCGSVRSIKQNAVAVDILLTDKQCAYLNLETDAP